MMKTQLKYTAVLTISAVLFGCGGGGGGSATAPANAGSESKGTTVPAVVDTGKTDTTTTDPTKTDTTTTDPTKTDPTKTDTGNTDPVQQPDQSAGSQRLADGVWFGKTVNNDPYTSFLPSEPAFALIAGTGKDQPTQIYIASQSGGSYHARSSGKMTLFQGAITGSDVLDSAQDATRVPLSLGGKAVAANTLTAQLLIRDVKIDEYQFNYSADSQGAAGLDKLQGTYGNPTNYGINETMKIDAQGKLTGNMLYCELSGQISPLDEHNMYKIALHVKPTHEGNNCLTMSGKITGEVDMTGLVTLAKLPNESTPSLLFATSATQPGGKYAMLASAMAKK